MRIIAIARGGIARYSRLGRLIDYAHGAAAQDTTPSPVPHVVRRVALGLLDWKAELKASARARELNAAILYETREGCAFACLGGAAPRVTADGRPLDLAWTVFDDASGDEVRAFFVDAGSCQRVNVEWAVSGQESGGSMTLEGEWLSPGPLERPAPESAGEFHGAAVAPEIVPFPDAAAPDAAPAEAEQPDAAALAAAGEEPGPGRGDPRLVVGWWDRFAKRVRPDAETIAPAPGAIEGEAGSVERTAAETPDPATYPAEPAAADPAAAPQAAAPREPAIAREVEPAREAARSPQPERVPDLEGAAALDFDLVQAPERDASAAPDEQGAADEDRPEPAPRVRQPMRPAWPDPSDLERGPRRSRLAVPLAVVLAVVLALGWLMVRSGALEQSPASGSSLVTQLLRAVGLGGSSFECVVRSSPAGAWIAVDGVDLDRRTPATLNLAPGPHRITLTVPDFGSASYSVRGERGRSRTLEASLWGALRVRAASDDPQVEVSIDGTSRGLAPVEVHNLSPGPHEVGFSMPGHEPWLQTVKIRVSQRTEINARVLRSPENGLIDVRASQAGDAGVEDLEGATVWVDGERRGVTPLSLELPPGPHSIRAEYQGESAPVQVVDLPSGEQRFSTFQFGAGAAHPKLSLLSPSSPMPRDRSSVVSATVEGLRESAVSEMWLHVQAPDGSWRRYPMTVMAASGKAVGVAVFPLALLDASGRAPYYVSATSTLGEQYFTELQNPEPPGAVLARH